MPHSNCSVCQPPATSFSSRPIGSIATLARMLKTSVADLVRISAEADQLYRIGKQELKKDGTIRICFDALFPLKTIQARIQCLIRLCARIRQTPYFTRLSSKRQILSLRQPCAGL